MSPSYDYAARRSNRTEEKNDGIHLGRLDGSVDIVFNDIRYP